MLSILFYLLNKCKKTKLEYIKIYNKVKLMLQLVTFVLRLRAKLRK